MTVPAPLQGLINVARLVAALLLVAAAACCNIVVAVGIAVAMATILCLLVPLAVVIVPPTITLAVVSLSYKGNTQWAVRLVRNICQTHLVLSSLASCKQICKTSDDWFDWGMARLTVPCVARAAALADQTRG